MSISHAEWFSSLSSDEHNFIKKFILSSGSLKELAAIYNVTYPTVRLRLDRLISKILLTDNQVLDHYVNTIKNLAIDEKISIDTARFLINEYKKSKGDL